VKFDADLSACAGLVQKGDPDRFMAAMAAPVAARAVLFPIYALNVEVARAPWVTQEAMIAEMRLQWWRDALGEIAAGGSVRRHEVVTPLARVISADQAVILDEVITARRWDIYKEPFEEAAQFASHIDHSTGSLMWVAAQALGPADESVVRDYAYAAGLANWLRAVAQLQARGRVPLVDAAPDAVRIGAVGAGAREPGQSVSRVARGVAGGVAGADGAETGAARSGKGGGRNAGAGRVWAQSVFDGAGYHRAPIRRWSELHRYVWRSKRAFFRKTYCLQWLGAAALEKFSGCFRSRFTQRG